MEFLEILGYFGAVVIGFALGLLGGGGSILAVPVLVYLMGIDPTLATAYSLFIVGATSLIGAFKNMSKGLVHYKTAVVFAVPSFLAVYATRKFIVPAIPEEIVSLGDFTLTKPIATMVFFAIIMLAASYSMIKGRKGGNEEASVEDISFNFPMILAEGAVVGLLTGLVGAGGGFLIIPALVVFAKLPMKLAVGTSLLIIAAKSLIGFLGDVSEQEIDWVFLGSFSGLAVVGIFLGAYVSNFISGKALKKGFGWFVLLMGVFIMLNELVWRESPEATQTAPRPVEQAVELDGNSLHPVE